MTAQSQDRVDNAAVWATAHWWRSPRLLIPFSKHEFNLSEKEALTALRAASDELQRARR